MTEALVQFLCARLDEDALGAEQAGAELGPDWHYNADHGYVVARREYDLVATGSQDFLEPARGQYIARHDPARVLAEVDAKRRILDEALASRHHISSDQYETCPRATVADGLDDSQAAALGWLNSEHLQESGSELACWESCGRDARLRRTLKLLALPYADHPDYDEAWRP